MAVKNGRFMELLVERKILMNIHDGIEVEKRTDATITRLLTFVRVLKILLFSFMNSASLFIYFIIILIIISLL